MKRNLPERTFKFAKRVVKLRQIPDQAPGVNRALVDTRDNERKVLITN